MQQLLVFLARPFRLLNGRIQPLIPSRLTLFGWFAREQWGNTRPLVFAVFHNGGFEDLILRVFPHAAFDHNPHLRVWEGAVGENRAWTRDVQRASEREIGIDILLPTLLTAQSRPRAAARRQPIRWLERKELTALLSGTAATSFACPAQEQYESW